MDQDFPEISPRNLIVLPLIGLVLIAVVCLAPDYLQSSDYAPVSRVKADQRSLADALEAYFVDHNQYPAERPLRGLSENPEKLKRSGGWELTAIETGTGPSLRGITTPVTYITSMFPDPFTSRKMKKGYKGSGSLSPYAYHTDGNGWIVFSVGPDADYDINPLTDYDSHIPQPSNALLEKSYDPTNGRPSNGDVFRFSQREGLPLKPKPD